MQSPVNDNLDPRAQMMLNIFESGSTNAKHALIEIMLLELKLSRMRTKK